MDIPKIETRLEVKNEVDNAPAEMFLYGTIRAAYPWEDENSNVISSKRVRNEIANLKGKVINVHVNSGGGDVFESIAICNLLKQHDADVNIYIDGMAGSGASVIATAGKEIFMFKNSMQMIHNAWTVAWGNASELRKVADDLDKISNAVATSYMDKFVGTEEELKQLLADESFLTADECLAFGLCTQIVEAKEEKPEKKPAENHIKENLFNKYNKSIVAEVKEPTAKTTLFNKFRKEEN